MKLTSKLALALSIAMVVALFGYGYLSIQRQLRLFERDMIRDDRILGQVLVSALRDLWRREGGERALALLDLLDLEEPRIQVRWRWSTDPELASLLTPEERQALLDGRPVSRIDGHEVAPRFLWTRVPLRPPGAPPGFVEIADSLQERDSYVRATILRLVVLAGLVLLLEVLVAWILGAWIVGRPVEALVEKARRVGQGDLEGPLELSSSDELGTLAAEMNEMCDRLAAARTALVQQEQVQRNIEAQLQHAERLATVGALASGVAHELGTPLNVIGGRARMIEEGDVEGEASRESAAIIRAQAERISKTIRQLLAFSRRNEPRRSTVNLGDLLHTTLGLLEDAGGRSGVTTEIELGEEPILAEVDAGQVQQVLINLILNAFQAVGEEGTIQLAVRRVAEVRPPPGHAAPGALACVEVRDDGHGIRPEELPHVFEPFFTTKEVGEGTGLGLSVAYGIVEEHGGWIEVESEPGRGATFRVLLPLEGIRET